jgi:hypothetical protein
MSSSDAAGATARSDNRPTGPMEAASSGWECGAARTARSFLTTQRSRNPSKPPATTRRSTQTSRFNYRSRLSNARPNERCRQVARAFGTPHTGGRGRASERSRDEPAFSRLQVACPTRGFVGRACRLGARQVHGVCERTSTGADCASSSRGSTTAIRDSVPAPPGNAPGRMA